MQNCKNHDGSGSSARSARSMWSDAAQSSPAARTSFVETALPSGSTSTRTHRPGHSEQLGAACSLMLGSLAVFHPAPLVLLCLDHAYSACFSGTCCASVCVCVRPLQTRMHHIFRPCIRVSPPAASWFNQDGSLYAFPAQSPFYEALLQMPVFVHEYCTQSPQVPARLSATWLLSIFRVAFCQLTSC